MSKGPMKGTHGAYVKGTAPVSATTGATQRPYYNGTNAGHNSSGAKHTPSPCRYWRQGTCKLGDSCRFSHEGSRPTSTASSSGGTSTSTSTSTSLSSSTNLKSSTALRGSTSNLPSSDALTTSTGNLSVSSNTSISSSQGGTSSLAASSVEIGEGLTMTPTHDRTGRRPFLKVVVLYASDSRVLRYAKDVQTQFLDTGIDVYLQIDIDNVTSPGTTSTGGTSVNLGSNILSGVGSGKDSEIKTENLAEIITSSTNADFLIVIGDRNMKNQSCQVKKRGKLVEMDVGEMINAIWAEWSPFQADFADLDPTLAPQQIIDSLSPTHLYIILQRFPPQVNFEEALRKTGEAVDEVKLFGKTKSGALSGAGAAGAGLSGKQKKPQALPSLMTSSQLGSNVVFDEKQTAKFQALQKNLVRLHKQVLGLQAHLTDLPEARTEETFVIDSEQFGRTVGPDYRPQQVLTSQISAILRARLLEALEDVETDLEALASELIPFGAGIWNTYLTQLHGGVEHNSDNLAASTDGLSPSSTSLVHNVPNAGTTANATANGAGVDHTPWADARTSAVVPPTNEWSCFYCTAFNELYLKDCKVCGNPRANADEGEWETAGEKKAKKKRDATAPSVTSLPATAPNTTPAASVTTPNTSTHAPPTTVTKEPTQPAVEAHIPASISSASTTTTSTASASASASTTTPSTSGPGSGKLPASSATAAQPKKKLLDPIPGLSAAKQATATKATSTKTSAPPSAPSAADSKSTSNTTPAPFTYSSIVSGSTNTATSTTTAPQAASVSSTTTAPAPAATSVSAALPEHTAFPPLLSAPTKAGKEAMTAPVARTSGKDDPSTFALNGADSLSSTGQYSGSTAPWTKSALDSLPSEAPSFSGLILDDANSALPPVGLRTPTKSHSISAVPPHTPTFTTPFKGRSGSVNGASNGPVSALGSRYASLERASIHSSPPLVEDLQQAEPKFGVSNPCWYCGEEASVECNLCPKVGLETYFCERESSTSWKHHLRTCHPINLGVNAGSFETNSYNGGSYLSSTVPYMLDTRRDASIPAPLPRYSSSSSRQKYS